MTAETEIYDFGAAADWALYEGGALRRNSQRQHAPVQLPTATFSPQTRRMARLDSCPGHSPRFYMMRSGLGVPRCSCDAAFQPCLPVQLLYKDTLQSRLIQESFAPSSYHR